MAIRPSVPEVITVNSEALQTQIRDLLPSQNGFGSELQASNVITPIIDLTSTAEGSGLPTYLQTAIAFGSQTSFLITNATGTTIVSSPGFYRIFGVATLRDAGNCQFDMTDGLSTKSVWQAPGDAGANLSVEFDFTVFLAPGESLTGTGSTADAILSGSSRQVATGDGTLVQPSGFPL